MRSLVISIFLYDCESWILTAELEKRMQAFQMRCYRRLLNISYQDMLSMRRFAERSKQQFENMMNILTLVKKRKPRWFGRMSRSSGLAKTILKGTMKEKKKERQTEEEMGRQNQRVDRGRLFQLD